jgi:hypothetical protein
VVRLLLLRRPAAYPVVAEPFIVRHGRQPFRHRLPDQDAVKGIVVMAWKLARGPCMRDADRQRPE